MADTRLAEMTRLLLEKTKGGEVKWEKTSTAGRFQAPFARFTIVIQGTRDSPYLYLFNEQGDSVEDFSGISAISLSVLNEFQELYEAARRQALASDKALDEILNILRVSGEKN